MNEKLFGKKPKHYRLKKHISQTQFIAYGFFLIIMTGSLLLMLPIASRDGQSEPFLNCLFTATSASCVTGLVVADTWTQWSLFGQMVLLFREGKSDSKSGGLCRKASTPCRLAAW